MLKLMLGLLIGGTAGVFTMALMQINRGEPHAD